MSSKTHRLFVYTGPPTNLAGHGPTQTNEVVSLSPAQANYVAGQTDSHFVDTGEMAESSTERISPVDSKKRWPKLVVKASKPEVAGEFPKVGDTVWLNSGSPDLKVVAIGEDDRVEVEYIGAPNPEKKMHYPKDALTSEPTHSMARPLPVEAVVPDPDKNLAEAKNIEAKEEKPAAAPVPKPALKHAPPPAKKHDKPKHRSRH